MLSCIYSRTAEKAHSRKPAFIHPHTYPVPGRMTTPRIFQTVSRETVWKVLRTSQPPDHEPRHRRVDKCLSGGAQPLVVFGHPPVVADPREGALHHPPPRQHCEISRGQKLLPVHLLAFFGPLLCPELGYLLREWLSRLAHDLDAQTQYLLGPPSAPSSVAGIDP